MKNNYTKLIAGLVFILFATSSSSQLFLSGEILTEDDQAIEKVIVHLENETGDTIDTFITAEDGKYNFGLILSFPVTIRPERNDNPKNGVSTLDIIKLQKHLLGIERLQNPYDIIAADANNSQHISVVDMLELRKLILGIYSEFPNNNSWRFIAADHQFSDMTDPWFQDTVIPQTSPDEIVVTDASPENLDFIGIKIGDLNNTVQANVFRSEERRVG